MTVHRHGLGWKPVPRLIAHYSPLTTHCGTGFQPERLLIAIAYAIAIVFRNVVFVLRVLFLLKPET